MARILIVGGGARGRMLARGLVGDGHAVRITTRSAERRAQIEATGAQCWIGTPDRLATLRHALENVTLACWLLGTACGEPELLASLHGSRLEFFISQTIDTTVRGIIYEAAGSVEPALLAQGAGVVRAKATYNAIPFRVLDSDPAQQPRWLAAARGQIEQLL